MNRSLTPEDQAEQQLDENEQILLRREKLHALRKQGQAYPNDFKPDAFAAELHELYANSNEETLVANPVHVRIAGRIMTRRIMGKASFAHIQDMSGKIQLYFRSDAMSAEGYEEFKTWDLGDIIGVEGTLFRTKTGELSVRVTKARLLTKSLRPLPDKFHGLVDHEARSRQRYLDLMVNPKSRRVFQIRAQIVTLMRNFLFEHGYIEVETPMMQTLFGGAAARPFITHHNTLDLDLYLRIAPELFLKRLVVGGFERVFEINRNFRNEGIDTQHNPEFTMIEFYQAYATYHDLMNLTENMLRMLAQEILGTTKLVYQGIECDLAKPFIRMTVKEAILHFNPDVKESELNDLEQATKIAQRLGIEIHENYGLGKIQIEIFEKTAEKLLLQPTFITAYPTEVSPLARQNDEDPFVTDRFEFFIAGREIANGFSELNDPEEQAARLRQQVEAKAAGDEEAMPYDEDYVNALEYGLPPTAGEGMGIDRLAMIFTDSASIRDVILFPLLRPL